MVKLQLLLYFVIISSKCVTGNGPSQLLQDTNNLVLAENTSLSAPVFALNTSDLEDASLYGIGSTAKFGDEVAHEVAVKGPRNDSAEETVTARRESDEPHTSNNYEHISVVPENLPNVTSLPHLEIESDTASDGLFSSVATVNISVHDVNNNNPVFGRESYVASVQEDAPVGVTPIPALTGSTNLTTFVSNSNDNNPHFQPRVQRAEVCEDISPRTVFYTLKVEDSNNNGTGTRALNFSFAEPISAVDGNNKQIIHTEEFKSFFAVDENSGEVMVRKKLNRSIAAMISITVLMSDTATPNLSQEKGTLVITIIPVNDFYPTFARPWTPENPRYVMDILEEQPVGSTVVTLEASDAGSNIAAYEIEPESEYFEINNATGVVRTKKRIDYESVKSINFTVVAYDSGIPQKSASANVTVNIININDMDPVFSQPVYEATVMENSPEKTPVITVRATDGDEGVIGSVTYSLVGEHSSDFSVDYVTGEVTVANPALLDRETNPDITIQVMASDGAPPETRRTVAVPIHIHLRDANDNSPVFTQQSYPVVIMENLHLDFSSPIVQVHAEDADEGENGAVRYNILSGNDDEVFRLDKETGTLYPAKLLKGKPRQFHLLVEGRDEEGNGPNTGRTTIDIKIQEMNQNEPMFIIPSLPNATIEVPENAGIVNFLVITVKATDKDEGENGQISYHLKVNNKNVHSTDEFVINADTGELRTKIILDREVQAKYELVLVAKDHGTPISHETLRFLTVLLVDSNDNKPEFPVTENSDPYIFRVVENSEPGLVIGGVSAVVQVEGNHVPIFYHMISGNEDGSFLLGRTTGSISTTVSFDREKRDEYNLYIKATNDPHYYMSEEEKERLNDSERDSSIAHVMIKILDENDNPPQFEHSNYYSGINAMADINESVAKLSALDPDAADNGTVIYYISSCSLYKSGSNLSREIIVPPPFNVTEDGKLVTANYMAEYNQDRFVLDVIAKEKAPPGREATAKVHIWIFQPDQLIRVILSRPPEEVNQERVEIIAELSNVTRSLVVVDDIRYHVDSLGYVHHDWCDMYLHVVDGATQTIAPIPEVLKLIDAKYDFLKDYYAGFAIENVVPAFLEVREEPFDPTFSALIALLIVIFVGCISFIVICCCLRHWVVTVPSDFRKKEALIKKEILDNLNTRSPLWSEHKLKLYEEQDVMMQVYKPKNVNIVATKPHPITERSDNIKFSQDSNFYTAMQCPSSLGLHNSVTSVEGDVLKDYSAPSGGSNLHRKGYPHISLCGVPRDRHNELWNFQGSTFRFPEQPVG